MIIHEPQQCGILFKENFKMTKLFPTGQLKTKADVYCEICGCKHTRRLSVFVYNKDEAIQQKAELLKKANAKYTCKVCKSIVKGNLS